MNPRPTAGSPGPGPDPHGQAALLLVESLIHGLAARSVLSVGEAVAIIQTALDTQIEIMADASSPTASMQNAIDLLSAIVDSLSLDLPAAP